MAIALRPTKKKMKTVVFSLFFIYRQYIIKKFLRNRYVLIQPHPSRKQNQEVHFKPLQSHLTLRARRLQNP